MGPAARRRKSGNAARAEAVGRTAAAGRPEAWDREGPVGRSRASGRPKACAGLVAHRAVAQLRSAGWCQAEEAWSAATGRRVQARRRRQPYRCPAGPAVHRADDARFRDSGPVRAPRSAPARRTGAMEGAPAHRNCPNFRSRRTSCEKRSPCRWSMVAIPSRVDESNEHFPTRRMRRCRLPARCRASSLVCEPRIVHQITPSRSRSAIVASSRPRRSR